MFRGGSLLFRCILTACPSLDIIHRGPNAGVSWDQAVVHPPGKSVETPLAEFSNVVGDQRNWPSGLKRLKFFCAVLDKFIHYGLNKNEDLTILASALQVLKLSRHRAYVMKLLDLIDGGVRILYRSRDFETHPAEKSMEKRKCNIKVGTTQKQTAAVSVRECKQSYYKIFIFRGISM